MDETTWAAQGTYMGDLCRHCWGSERSCGCPDPDYRAVYRFGADEEED